MGAVSLRWFNYTTARWFNYNILQFCFLTIPVAIGTYYPPVESIETVLLDSFPPAPPPFPPPPPPPPPGQLLPPELEIVASIINDQFWMCSLHHLYIQILLGWIDWIQMEISCWKLVGKLRSSELDSIGIQSESDTVNISWFPFDCETTAQSSAISTPLWFAYIQLLHAILWLCVEEGAEEEEGEEEKEEEWEGECVLSCVDKLVTAPERQKLRDTHTHTHTRAGTGAGTWSRKWGTKAYGARNTHDLKRTVTLVSFSSSSSSPASSCCCPSSSCSTTTTIAIVIMATIITIFGRWWKWRIFIFHADLIYWLGSLYIYIFFLSFFLFMISLLLINFYQWVYYDGIVKLNEVVRRVFPALFNTQDRVELSRRFHCNFSPSQWNWPVEFFFFFLSFLPPPPHFSLLSFDPPLRRLDSKSSVPPL